ncbi:MAG: hypothetical protein WBP29_04210, partial [Candidatus Zixiibacteriota bacterium]
MPSKIRHLFASITSATVVTVCLISAASIAQSCRDKLSESIVEEKPDTTVHWLQSAIDRWASWSPDGSKIIYMREKAGSGRDTSWLFGAFIHDVNLNSDTCIWPNVRFDGFSWAPDSRKVAVIQAGQVYIYDFDADSLERVTSRYRNYSVSWSPCGDKIVFFDRFNYVGMQVYDLEADSIIIVKSEDQTFSGDWMPNCSTIIVLDSCRHTDCGVYGYNFNSDSLWLIVQAPGYKTYISASPQGNGFVYSADYEVWYSDLSGAPLRQLTTEGGDYPDWSPDGQWIVFTKLDKRNGYLWIMRP